MLAFGLKPILTAPFKYLFAHARNLLLGELLRLAISYFGGFVSAYFVILKLGAKFLTLSLASRAINLIDDLETGIKCVSHALENSIVRSRS